MVTSPTNQPNSGNKNGGTLTAPMINSTVPALHGGGSTPFGNAARASVDPIAAIVGAAALNRAVKQPAINTFLTDKSKPAVLAARESMGDLFKKSAQSSLARGVTVASAEAAKRGAILGSRFAAMALLRAGTMSIPALWLAINAALWVFDTESRKAFNNLVSTILGPGAAPALDAAPEPPRTQFLPLTHDGNRDPIIERMDQGMVNSNDTTFGFDPNKVWPPDPAITTTSNFAPVLDRFNALSKKLDALNESITATFNMGQGDKYVAGVWAKTKPGIEALEELKASVIPAMGAQLSQGAVAGNNAYQAFRKVNADNRIEINNSTSGLLPFAANHVNESKMSNSSQEMKSAADAMSRAAQGVASAADGFTVPLNGVGLPSENTSGPSTRTQNTTPVPPAAPVAPAAPPAAKADPVKDALSALRGGMPNGMGMPGGMAMPTLPGLGSGGAPQIPGLGNGMGGPKPIDKDLLDRLKDKEKDKDKPKADEKEKPKVDPVTGAPINNTTPPGKPVPAGNPTAPVGTPAANTTQIKGKTFTFDNPRLRDFAHNMTGTDGSAHKTVRQAAAEAGFKLPPPGEDIGRKIDNPAQFKPGMAIMGPGNQNAVYLGEQGGQAWAYSETQGLTTLDKLPKADGPHQGFFALNDGGTPASPQTQQASVQAPAPAPADQPPTPPTGSPSAADTNTGIDQSRSTAPAGLNPANLPSGN